jgi:hypothetical protein
LISRRSRRRIQQLVLEALLAEAAYWTVKVLKMLIRRSLDDVVETSRL